MNSKVILSTTPAAEWMSHKLPPSGAVGAPRVLVQHRGQLVFLFLILAQGAYSIEEYITKLYEIFAPV
jgi:hypothetical protein